MTKRLITRILFTVFLLITTCGCVQSPSNKINFENKVINDNVLDGEKVKENVVANFTTLKNQTVYTVGTLHDGHFHKKSNYSFKDLESLLINVNPDYIFIESREETFDKYGAVDGPIEMIFAYSYGKDHNIPVKMIDYWKLDNAFEQNSSNDFRDNKIFYNINDKLKEIECGKRIVILFGGSHFYHQRPRIDMAGWTENKIEDIDTLFASSTDKFSYPESFPDEIQKKINFANNDMPEIAKKNITDSKVFKIFLNKTEELSEDLAYEKELVKQNILYIE